MTDNADTHTEFLSTFDWLRYVLTRYPDNFRFALVKISYCDSSHLGGTYGAPEASRKLSQIAESLRKSFRKSDLIARDGTDFWLILPYSPFSENVHEKLMNVLQESDHEALNIVDREIAIFETPRIQQELLRNRDGSCLDFLRSLGDRQEEFASKVFKFEASN